MRGRECRRISKRLKMQRLRGRSIRDREVDEKKRVNCVSVRDRRGRH